MINQTFPFEIISLMVLMINANYDSSLMSKTESDLIVLSLCTWEALVSAIFFLFMEKEMREKICE